MKYAFELNWKELPLDLRNKKIQEVIDYWEVDCQETNGEDYDVELYERAEEYIKSYFPVYF